MKEAAIAQIAATLRAFPTRATAEEIAAKLRGQALDDVIAELGITTRRDVQRKRSDLVEWAAGRRADSDAIHRAVYSTT